MRTSRLTDDQRSRMLAEMNAAYALLHNDPIAWQEYLDELSVWDQILMDGLEESLI